MNQTTNISDKIESDNFFLQQMQTPCLSLFSYYIESNNEAIIIDPLRDIDMYLDLLKERNVKLKYIIETHFHADFVSGHIDLHKKTGATIVYGPSAEPKYEIHQAKDGEILNLGKIQIKVLHTPGHTLESSCFLLIDEEKPYCVFTGDTVFLGDCGRPDLSVGGNLSKADLAGLLYDSIKSKIKTLPNNVIIYPAHGAGSGCGKNIGAGVKCTVGVQKENNYALGEFTKDEFVELLTTGISKPPSYFFYDAKVNQEGYEIFHSVLEKSNKPIKVEQFMELSNQPDVVILDTRDSELIPNGYIAGSITISIKSPFAVWVGKIISPSSKLLLVCDSGREKEVITRLGRIGFDSVIGYLEGGFETWLKAGGQIYSFVSNADYAKVVEDEKNILVDVREAGEVSEGVVGKAIHCPLSDIQNYLSHIPKDEGKDLFIYCKSGMRSLMACSILQKSGFKNKIHSMKGGFSQMMAKGITVSPLQK